VEIDPGFSMAYLTLGGIAMDLEEMQDAIRYYQLYLKHETSAQAAEMRAEVKAVVEGLKEELENQGKG